MDVKMNIDIINNDKPWGNVKISDGDILVGMYEGGKVERILFLMLV